MAHVISKQPLRAFWMKHRDAERELASWFKVARRATWTKIADVREHFRGADQVGRCIVFNICHNSYRLIVTVSKNWRRIYVRHVLTHEDYNKNTWKNDCGT